jgi:hypothetical protein
LLVLVIHAEWSTARRLGVTGTAPILGKKTTNLGENESNRVSKTKGIADLSAQRFDGGTSGRPSRECLTEKRHRGGLQPEP